SDVAALGCVNAVEMPDAFAVLRVLAVSHVDLVVVDHWRADQLVARLWPNRILRVAIELPELLSGHRVITAHPTVALTVNHLNHVADFANRRRRPLTVQNAIAYRVVFPRQLACLLVERNDRRSFWRRNVDVTLILPVRRADVEQVAVRHR